MANVWKTASVDASPFLQGRFAKSSSGVPKTWTGKFARVSFLSSGCTPWLEVGGHFLSNVQGTKYTKICRFLGRNFSTFLLVCCFIFRKN